jgi:VCBS repeat-containing protein
MLFALNSSLENRLITPSMTSSLAGPAQLTRADVLGTLDSVILHTIPDLTVVAKKDEFKIRLLPILAGHQSGLLSVVSVTQGAHGAVRINRNGTLTYNSDSRIPLADHFTVTIQNSEGDSLVKSITIKIPSHGERDDHCDKDGEHGK